MDTDPKRLRNSEYGSGSRTPIYYGFTTRVYNKSTPPAADESPLLADGFSSFPYKPEIMIIRSSV